MSFKLGDYLIKEIMYGYASEPSVNFTGLPLYILTQLSEGTIDITSDSDDIMDKSGNLVKKIWKAKKGELSAKNAFINGNIMEAASGSKADFASEGNKIKFPKLISGKPGSKIDITGYVTGTIKVNALYGDGTMGDRVADDVVSAAISENTLTLPEKMGDADAFIVKFVRECDNGAVIRNKADKYPSSVDLLLKCKYYDPCSRNKVKPIYVHIPSFQVSPETSISLSSANPNMDYKGSLEIDYCSIDKILYETFIPGDEEEDDD